MGLFGNLKTDGLEKQKETVGGGARTIPTDIYEFDIKAAYVGNSTSSKAMSVTLLLIGPENREMRETVWVTNGQGDNKFEIKDKERKGTGKFAALPGFALINDISMIVADKPLSEMDTEEKVLKLYNFDSKKEEPTSVQVLTELTGGKIACSVREIKKFKQKKDDNGDYQDTADTTQINEIDKAFFPQFKATVREVEEAMENGGSVTDDAVLDKDGNNVSTYWAAWLNQWQGKLIDKTTRGSGNAGKSGKPTPTGNGGEGQKTERKSLFGKG